MKPLSSADIKYQVFLCLYGVTNQKGLIKSFKMAQTKSFYLHQLMSYVTAILLFGSTLVTLDQISALLPFVGIKQHVLLCFHKVNNQKGLIKSFKMAQTRSFYLYQLMNYGRQSKRFQISLFRCTETEKLSMICFCI